MHYVRVKGKFQVTLPAKVRKELNLKEGDLLEAQIKAGSIVLSPRVIERRTPSEQTSEQKQARYERMAASFGAAKGLYSSAKEIDEHIRRERDSWDN